MGKVKKSFEHLVEQLFIEQQVGQVLRKTELPLALADIQRTIGQDTISEQVLSMAMTQLVAHGIAIPAICDNAEVKYSISDFGRYFFERIEIENNSEEMH